MQDFWYGDKLDLIKWGVLFRLADRFGARRILQIAFNPCTMKFGRLVIDGKEDDIPPEVIAHFRNMRTIGSISSKIAVTVFDPMFQERAPHLKAVLAFLAAFPQERCIVFLDPDTGLQPQKQKPSRSHVLISEARAIWDAMKSGEVFALYQHETNKAGQEWVGPKQTQLARALGVQPETVKIANGPSISKVVAIFYTQRPDTTVPNR